jgi:hypothetical protein
MLPPVFLAMDEALLPMVPYPGERRDPDHRAWPMGTVERVERPATELFRNPVDTRCGP